MPSVEEIRARRPREVVTARTLLIIAVVLWMPVAGHLADTAGLSVVSMFFCVSGAFGAARGRQAARVMAVVAVAVIYLFLLPYCVLGFRDPYPYSAAYAVIDMVAVLVSGIALTLLYRPHSNRYFDQITTARQTSNPANTSTPDA
ncbi:hypothetical protein [Actinophytocola sediminis]